MKYLPATKNINPTNCQVEISGNNNFAAKTGVIPLIISAKTANIATDFGA